MATAYYTRGETKAIRVSLTDANGTALNITGYTRVKAAIAASGTATALLTRDTDSDNSTKIAVTATPARVDIYPTVAESLALTASTAQVPLYIDVWVYLSSKWIASEKVNLIVSEGLSEPSA